MSLIILNTIEVRGAANRQRIGLHSEKISDLSERNNKAYFKYTSAGIEHWYLVEESKQYILNHSLVIPATDITLNTVSATITLSTADIISVSEGGSEERVVLIYGSTSRDSATLKYRIEDFVNLVNVIPEITVGTVAPGTPSTNDLWVDTN